MGLQEMGELQLRRRGGNMRVDAAAGTDDQAAGDERRKKAAAAAVRIALPLIRPVKVGSPRHCDGATDEDREEEEVTTPRGEGCRIPAEAGTCPPAPKKPRMGAVAIFADRRCNCDDGEVTEYYRVPADLDSVFIAVGRVAQAN